MIKKSDMDLFADFIGEMILKYWDDIKKDFLHEDKGDHKHGSVKETEKNEIEKNSEN